jgi:hypothetical protein
MSRVIAAAESPINHQISESPDYPTAVKSGPLVDSFSSGLLYWPFV